MNWGKWFFWKFIVRRVAKAQGFIDPIALVTKLQNFAQPSEVLIPVEIMRLAFVLQARGLVNSQAIQHNLDWVWPHWVERQFDPADPSFIPRAFSMTHINLTHRNWTAVGVPDREEMPIVDPRGLVTPFYDGWSLDTWLLAGEERLFPSLLGEVRQELLTHETFAVRTLAEGPGGSLEWTADVELSGTLPVCRLQIWAQAQKDGWLAVSLRPFNPEGVSFIDKIDLHEQNRWTVNGSHLIAFDQPMDRHALSYYREGDVVRKLPAGDDLTEVKCHVGMASAAALFKLKAGVRRQITVRVPLKKGETAVPGGSNALAREKWKAAAAPSLMQIADRGLVKIDESALASIVLLSPKGEIYPGPYTYKHFWFRDAAMILNAMLCAGLTERAEKILDTFPSRQRPTGYFHSQDGEWDSNGQVLWIMHRFCELTGKAPKPEWKGSISRAAKWIRRKRLPASEGGVHARLLPSGFSAEHLGPNDYYFWDDFWAVAGLRGAAALMEAYGEPKEAKEFRDEADDLLRVTEEAIEFASKRTEYSPAIPASPYRRMDSGCIGSIAADYPLRLWPAGDARIEATIAYILDHCFIRGGFFHDMSHSGINPYLTLYVAQCLLRAGDGRYLEVLKAVAGLASPTGQWPEAMHPKTGFGCMGDGHHIWACAEWVLMMRNCFIREEEGRLILASGVAGEWLLQGPASYGPAPTPYGPVKVIVERKDKKVRVRWEASWRGAAPEIEVRLPGRTPAKAKADAHELEMEESRA